MQANVSQLIQEPIGSTRQLAVDAEVRITGVRSPARGEVTLTRTDKGIFVQGKIESEISLTCGRCLDEGRLPVTLDIAEEFIPTTDAETQSGHAPPKPEGPASFTIDEHHVIDLQEAIRQYAEMKLPMKPLCRQDCAGLCPSCGKNLNKGNCECRGQETDPRWAALHETSTAGKKNEA